MRCPCCPDTKSCLTLCDRTVRSTPGFPVLRHLPEFAQTRAHGGIHPSHRLLPLVLRPPVFPRIGVFPREMSLGLWEAWKHSHEPGGLSAHPPERRAGPEPSPADTARAAAESEG